jgi:hypothetical protein
MLGTLLKPLSIHNSVIKQSLRKNLGVSGRCLTEADQGIIKSWMPGSL